MSRICLVHWNTREAARYAARLGTAGHEVTVFADPQAGTDLRQVRDAPPDAFVIGLDRLPSHGRAIGQWVRDTKALRTVPLLFVGGEAAKVERVRGLLPDATYTSWAKLKTGLQEAMRQPRQSPVRPGTLAGYSGTPLPRKLGIKPGAKVLLLHAPKDFETTLGALPPDVQLRRAARGTGEVVLLFAPSIAALEQQFAAAERALATGGRLWIAWPKKASGVLTDVTEPQVRAFGLARGLVDYKICAIDATWSGLCFARRTATAPAAKPAK